MYIEMWEWWVNREWIVNGRLDLADEFLSFLKIAHEKKMQKNYVFESRQGFAYGSLSHPKGASREGLEGPRGAAQFHTERVGQNSLLL